MEYLLAHQVAYGKNEELRYYDPRPLQLCETESQLQSTTIAQEESKGTWTSERWTRRNVGENANSRNKT